MTDFQTNIKKFSARFNDRLESLFVKPEGPEKRVVEAMTYSVMIGGKRLRPFLVYATASLFGKDFDASFIAGASLEMLHTYSLIHDDLPAMDNDNLRRGKPTCHRQFDEATAILAGDGLLTYAFELLATSNYSSEIKTELTALLAKAAGAFDGMVAGQMLDLWAENIRGVTNPTEIIRHIEEMKTGCLLRYACESGAVIGQASLSERQTLCAYARHIGIAFQITDDILDVEGDSTLVGKTLNKDAEQNKLTFVNAYGLDQAKRMAAALIEKAKAEIEIFGPEAADLRSLADFITERHF